MFDCHTKTGTREFLRYSAVGITELLFYINGKKRYATLQIPSNRQDFRRTDDL